MIRFRSTVYSFPSVRDLYLALVGEIAKTPGANDRLTNSVSFIRWNFLRPLRFH